MGNEWIWSVRRKIQQNQQKQQQQNEEDQQQKRQSDVKTKRSRATRKTKEEFLYEVREKIKANEKQKTENEKKPIRKKSDAKVLIEQRKQSLFELPFKQKAREEYQRTGNIPQDIMDEMEPPELIRQMGLSGEYKQEAYESYLGLNKPETVKRGGYTFTLGGMDTDFERIFKKRWESLPATKQFELGLKYGDVKDKPVTEWKYYEGGSEYIMKNADRITESFIKSKGGYDDFFKSMDIPVVDVAYKYASGGGDIFSKKFAKSFALDFLTTTKPKRREKYFSKLSPPVRAYTSLFHSTAKTSFWPVTLPQAVVKHFNEDRTLFLPDIEKQFQKVDMGSPSGLISTGISEGAGIVTGKESDAWEKFTKYPLSGISATVGEFAGMYIGGKALNVGKVGVFRGAGKLRSSLNLKFNMKLPSYEAISYHFPHRYIRRSWVKLGTKNIDDVIGKPYHSTATLTDRGLSFAKGKTPSSRISWTVKKAVSSKELLYSGDDILLGSSGASRIGSRYVIKAKTLHELPSLSTTPYGYAPTRFYRFGGSSQGYSSGISLLPKINTPSGFAIRIKKLFKPPKGSYSDIAKWSKSQPKGGWGTVAPKMYMGGAETEINIFGRTVLKRFLPDADKTLLHRFKGYQFYTKVPLSSGKTEVVPVVFSRPIHKGFPSGLKLISQSKRDVMKDFFSISSSSGKTYTPVFNPSYLGQKLISSFGSKPSRSSYSFSFSKMFPSYSTSKSFSSISKSFSISKSSGKSYKSSPSSILKSKSAGSSFNSISKSVSSVFSSISKSIQSSSSFSLSSGSSYMSSSGSGSYGLSSGFYYKSGKGRKRKQDIGYILEEPKYLFREFTIPDLDKLASKTLKKMNIKL